MGLSFYATSIFIFLVLLGPAVLFLFIPRWPLIYFEPDLYADNLTERVNSTIIVVNLKDYPYQTRIYPNFSPFFGARCKFICYQLAETKNRRVHWDPETANLLSPSLVMRYALLLQAGLEFLTFVMSQNIVKRRRSSLFSSLLILFQLQNLKLLQLLLHFIQMKVPPLSSKCLR